MRDILSRTGGMTSMRISGLEDDKPENSVVWNSIKVQRILDDHENGLIDIKTLKNSPFKDNDPAWKKQNIVYEYSPEEMEELRKCKADVVYFAEKYCQIMTEEGVRNIDLHDYQKEIVQTFKRERFTILMASRQVGKTWMSSVFIAWFLIFHFDKNSLVVADNAATTKEVIDKMKTIFEMLPFFLKPGCITNAVMSMKFDNGCRLIGRSTTKKTGIGFNIHLLYIDEFAHINEAYLDNFFRSIYPTISASKTSKVILTSTPNGMNKFYELYSAALEGKNEFVPLRVDWWQFPGRDDAWRAQTVGNMGSEEAFNQEYGLQFFASDKLLLNGKDLKKLFKFQTNYVPHNFNLEPEQAEMLTHFKVHPNFAHMSIDDIRNSPFNYIFSIDTADGLGKDHLVINIFKFTHLPIKMLTNIKNLIKEKRDIFGLVQVATFRTNEIDINSFVNVVEFLGYKVFNFEKVRFVIELNHKGDYVLDGLEKNIDYWPGQVVQSKHTLLAEYYKPGIRLSSGEMKNKICERFKYMVSCNKILPNEFKTTLELGAFGKSKAGTYRSQSGNDDLAITCVNASSFFESPNFRELADEALEVLPKQYVAELNAVIFTGDNNLDIEKQKELDMKALVDLNQTGAMRGANEIDRVFSADSIRGYKEAIDNFYST